MDGYPLYGDWAARLQSNSAGGMIMFSVAFLVIAYQLQRRFPLVTQRIALPLILVFFAILTLATISTNPPDPDRSFWAGIAGLCGILMVLAATLDSHYEKK